MASFEDKAIHYFTTAAEWEAFLAADPPDDGVRLQLRKKSSSAPGILWQEALEVALCYGWIDGQTKRLDDDFTLQAFTPRRRNSPWSQINQGHVARLIDEGRMRPAGQAEIDRAKADGRWEAAYRVKDAMPSAEFETALAANPAAAATWQTLSKQNRFAVIFRLSQAKRDETRTRNIEKYIAMLERGEKLF
jgi:uncharacterized protein YdeI (YjbR/CyaY-like superfamily)